MSAGDSLLLAMGTIVLLPAIAGTTGSVTGLLKDDMGTPVKGGKVTLVDKARGTSYHGHDGSKGLLRVSHSPARHV